MLVYTLDRTSTALLPAVIVGSLEPVGRAKVNVWTVDGGCNVDEITSTSRVNESLSDLDSNLATSDFVRPSAEPGVCVEINDLRRLRLVVESALDPKRVKILA